MADDVKLLFSVDPASISVMNSQIQAILRKIGNNSKIVIRHAHLSSKGTADLRNQIENALKNININGLNVNGVNVGSVNADRNAGRVNSVRYKAVNASGEMLRERLGAISTRGLSAETRDEVYKLNRAMMNHLNDIERIKNAEGELSGNTARWAEQRTEQLMREQDLLYDRADFERKNAKEEEQRHKQSQRRSSERQSSAKAEADIQNDRAKTDAVGREYARVEKLIYKNPRMKKDDRFGELIDARDELKRFYDDAYDATTKTRREFTKLDKVRFDQLKSQIREIDDHMTLAGKKGDVLTGKIKSMYKKYGSWSLVTGSMYHAIQGFRIMVDHIRDIDSAMTELKKVTNETDAAYSRFLEGATDRAESLGVTIADTVNATADFARMDYSLEEATELADAALVYKNVGDGIDDISVASQSIISTMKAFGIEAEGAMLIVDKFNEVGNNFAISSVGIGDALVRSAAALAAANNSLDESIALVTATNSVVQDPEKVGKRYCP